ncbi:uncharacterized protein BYT42DRAFT_124231 [Radiomyces spectabilis]|uniref:uncharacterized protein n=1 Tax=Radiomyces spectabilis TaxID=64574 RepID=UPI00221FFC7E|nr:uncharacterized protein BYT42DRAFT_124231 [Radiomyces spectabilis]KAI8368257.1 hypothetical protein BYT42DRAFT_124231 [Radiomyces spectabilis]
MSQYSFSFFFLSLYSSFKQKFAAVTSSSKETIFIPTPYVNEGYIKKMHNHDAVLLTSQCHIFTRGLQTLKKGKCLFFWDLLFLSLKHV